MFIGDSSPQLRYAEWLFTKYVRVTTYNDTRKTMQEVVRQEASLNFKEEEDIGHVLLPKEFC